MFTAEPHSVNLHSVISSLPGSNVLVLPDAPFFTIVAVSDDYLKATSRKREDLIGRGLFEVFPNNPEDKAKTSEKTVQASLEYALKHKEVHHLPMQRYDITTPDGRFEEHYWLAQNKPVCNENGEVVYLIHNVEDVTQNLHREAKIKSIEKAYQLFMQAPVIIGIVKGDNYVIELANAGILDLWGRGSDVIGKPLLDVVPELEGQGFIELLNRVRETGEPYFAYESPAVLLRKGKEEVRYFNFIYQPFYEANETKAAGVFNVAHDVTEQVLARRRLKESEEKYRSLFEALDQGFCVMEMIFDEHNKAIDYRFLETNAIFEKQTGLKNAVGKTARELVPDLEPYWFELYGRVALTGQAVRFVQRAEALNRWFEVYAYRTGGGSSQKVALLFNDITQRQQADEALKKSEERLQKALSIQTVGVIYFDLEGNINDANEAFLRMSGFSPDDLALGKIRWDQITPPEFMHASQTSKHELLTKWQNTPYEKQYIRPDGSRWWGLFSGKRLSEHECVEFVIDITEQKRIQNALEKSENNLRNIILHAPVGMCILRGVDLVVEIANQRMYEIWGKNASEMLGRPVFEALPEAGQQGLKEALAHSYTTGEIFSATEQPIALPRNGRVETTYINFVYEPLKNEEGIITGVIVVATEVTEQVIARKKVENKNKELEFVLNVMPQMVWHTQPDGAADFFNQVYLDYTSLSMEDLTGYQWMKLIHPDDLKASSKAWKSAVDGHNASYSLEHRLRGRDGTYRWFLTRGVALKDSSGTILKWYGTTTDIQEQKTAAEILEQRVQERTRDLQEANAGLTNVNRELEQFTHVSHHDLQEPLRKIIMFTDMVKADSYERLTEASQKRLDKVADAARRMSAALRDVLNFASLNKQEQFQEIDLDDVLAAVQMDLELVISEKGAKIHSDSLPTIHAIPRQMHQLLYNLLNNALKFSKTDQQPVIEISCCLLKQEEKIKHDDLDPAKDYYQIAVSDNGIGFNQDAADKIFGMFQRLHSREAYAGTGIGLALCKKVVLNHEGKIIAESEPGEGARFTVWLPVE